MDAILEAPEKENNAEIFKDLARLAKTRQT